MVATCLCFRDSATYLHEWLLFHAVQGVSRFYLYDNDSSDDYASVLAPWISAGWVQLTRWPGPAQQAAIYDDCLRRADQAVDWLAFIDDDEFLFSCDGSSLPVALKPYSDDAGVAVSWILYGASGHERRPLGWMIENFVQCAPGPDAHVKCIVHPRRVVRSRVAGHAFETLPGFSVVDEAHRPLSEPLNPTPSMERFRINHYLIRSWEEFLPRRLRPQVNTGTPKPHTLEQWREWNSWWSQVKDPAAQRHVPAMRELERTLLMSAKKEKRPSATLDRVNFLPRNQEVSVFAERMF